MAAKRLIISAILALGVHAILLGAEFGWLWQIPDVHLNPDTLTVSLSVQQPAKTINAAKNFQHAVTLKKTEGLKSPVQTPQKQVEEREKPQSIAEPKPTVLQPQQKELAATVHPATPSVEPEPKKSHAAVKMLQPKADDISTPHAIRRVRPFYRTNPRPEYPRMARTRGYQGNVVLEVLVDRKGRVSDLRVFKSSGYAILDTAAKKAVKNWLFEPGMIGNQKIDMWVRIPIRFELE